MRKNVMVTLPTYDEYDLKHEVRVKDGVPCETCGQLPIVVKPITLRHVCCEALVNGPSPKDDTAEKKLARWELAQKIAGADEPDFSAEELALLTVQIYAAYTAPAVYGPAAALLKIEEEPAAT